MDARAITAGETRHRFDRLHRAGFVIRQHDRDQGGRRRPRQGAFERREVDPPVAARRDPRRAGGGRENGIVLDGRDDRRRMGDSREGEIVGFGSAAGEDDALGRRVDQPRHFFAGVLHGSARGAPGPMNGGRVAAGGQHPGDRFGGCGANRRACVVIAIGEGRRHGALAPRAAAAADAGRGG